MGWRPKRAGWPNPAEVRPKRFTPAALLFQQPRSGTGNPAQDGRGLLWVRYIVGVAMLFLVCPSVAAAPARIESVDINTRVGTTEVTIHLSRPTGYRVRKLDPDGERPYRLYVDLADTKLPLGMKRRRPVTRGPVMQVRSGQFTLTQARVVLDLREYVPYKVETRRKPFRIILKVSEPSTRESDSQSQTRAPDPKREQRQEEKTSCAVRPHTAPPVPDGPRRAGAPRAFVDDPAPEPEDSQETFLHLARTFSAPVTIVIDPGHGGSDPGARSVEGTWEKDIVLEVAQELALRIRERLGVAVVLTRDGDETLSIAERVARAGSGAALLLSLHANTSPSPWMRGVETFYAQAGRHGPESRRLAHLVHHRVVRAIDADYGSVRDGGVRPRGLAVLRRAPAPAMLLEAAYISNPADLVCLTDSSYRNVTVDGIADGIADFLSGVPDPGVEVTRRKEQSPPSDLHVASHGTAAPDRLHR